MSHDTTGRGPGRLLGRAGLAAAALLPACGDPATPPAVRPQGAVEARFDLSGGFFDAPWPLESRRAADGALDLGGFVNPDGSELLARTVTTTEAIAGGFSANGAVFLPLTGPVDPAGLPAGPVADGAPVLLVDVDAASPERGRRLPVLVSASPDDSDHVPPDVLVILPYPGAGPRPGTLYAAVATRALRDRDGAPLGTAEPLWELLHGRAVDGGEALVEPFAALRAVLDESGLTPGEVAAATVFATADPVASQAALRRHAAARPPPEVTLVGRVRDHPAFCVVEARTTLPIYQQGERPFAEVGSGRIVFEGGEPVVQWEEEVRISLSLPRTRTPDGGFPLLLYAAGQGGSWLQVVDRGTLSEQEAPEGGLGPARYLAEAGIASLGVEAPNVGPRHPEGSSAGFDFFNVANLVAMRDNLRQGAVEYTVLAAAARSLSLPVAELGCDGLGALDDRVRFDADRLLFWGHSTGASIGALVLAVEPAFRAGVLSGTGGGWVYNLTLKQQPFPMRPLAEGLLGLPEGTLDEHHPAATLFQTALEGAEVLTFARHWVSEPLPGMLAKDVLLVEGVVDGYFPPRMVNALAMAAGLDVAEPLVEETLRDDLVWSGGREAPRPAGANRGERSAWVVQHAAEGFDGHHVAFELGAAKHDVRCWLRSVVEGGPGGVPALDDDPLGDCLP